MTWPAPIDAITVFCDDLAAAKAFYLEVFALSVVFEDDDSAAFAFGDTIVNLLRAEEAPELVAPVPVAESTTGVRVLLTLGVDDVDATCAMLAERGVALLNGPIDRPWGVRTAAFRDPAGTVWEIAARLDS